MTALADHGILHSADDNTIIWLTDVVMKYSYRHTVKV